MAEDLRMALQELLRKAELDGDIDFLRDGVRVLAQEAATGGGGRHAPPKQIRRSSLQFEAPCK